MSHDLLEALRFADHTSLAADRAMKCDAYHGSKYQRVIVDAIRHLEARSKFNAEELATLDAYFASQEGRAGPVAAPPAELCELDYARLVAIEYIRHYLNGTNPIAGVDEARAHLRRLLAAEQA